MKIHAGMLLKEGIPPPFHLYQIPSSIAPIAHPLLFKIQPLIVFPNQLTVLKFPSS